MLYKKSQIGSLMIGLSLLLLFLLFLAFVNQWGDTPVPALPYLILSILFVLILALFYQLQIELDGSILKVTYGVGLIKFRFPIDELVETRVIKTPWYYGLGIRITPKGMLYNIQGLKAVEIKYIRKGQSKTIMVGSAEPVKLKEVLDAAFLGKA